MSELIIRQNGNSRAIFFEGRHLLDDLLLQAGISTPHPCGGRGGCGKCEVLLNGAVSEPNEAEKQAGVRLSCQTVILGDAVVTLPEDAAMEQIETSTGEQVALCPMDGRWGAAVDIGTTTMAAKVFDLQSGVCIGTAACRNPQTAVAADVMGRIDAAMDGALPRLQEQVRQAIAQLLTDAAAEQVDAMVVTGNTTMLYLLTGTDPSCLSRAPFLADTLFDTDADCCGVQTYLPPCMHAFVGADITCAVLASGMCDKPGTALLCDIGTNGELAIWKDGVLYVTSTAAGPAFEGAGISCGCGSIRGAIDRVWVENGSLQIHTIAEHPAVGICGSGLIDAVASGLEIEQIDGTGALEEEELELAPGIGLEQRDIRAVQLAKAAIAAGIETLLETAGTTAAQISTLYIAGGFGSHLDIHSAIRIGLLPEELADRTVVLGNAALTGAVRALLNTGERDVLRRIAEKAVHVDLGGNPSFNEKYIEQMLFDDDV